jgi:hypothetical protein
VTECYRCGQEGHHRNQCPTDLPLPPAAPATRGAAVPPRINPDPDIARKGAQAIRDTLGWPPPQENP